MLLMLVLATLCYVYDQWKISSVVFRRPACLSFPLLLIINKYLKYKITVLFLRVIIVRFNNSVLFLRSVMAVLYFVDLFVFSFLIQLEKEVYKSVGLWLICFLLYYFWENSFVYFFLLFLSTCLLTSQLPVSRCYFGFFVYLIFIMYVALYCFIF